MSDKENIKISIKEAIIRFFLYFINIIISILILPIWSFLSNSSKSNSMPLYDRNELDSIKHKFGETNIYYEHVGNLISSLNTFLPKDLSLTFMIVSFLELFIIIACLRNKKFSSDHTIIILSKNIASAALSLSTLCTLITVICFTLLLICLFVYLNVSGISSRSLVFLSFSMSIVFLYSVGLLFFSKWIDKILNKSTK